MTELEKIAISAKLDKLQVSMKNSSEEIEEYVQKINEAKAALQEKAGKSFKLIRDEFENVIEELSSEGIQLIETEVKTILGISFNLKK